MRHLIFLLAAFFLFASMTDPLRDFSKVAEHSSNLKTDTINPGNFNNDSSRVVRTDTQPGTLIYQFENLNDYSIEFWTVDEQSGEIKVYLSEDGEFFQATETKTSVTDFGYRDREIIQPAEDIPDGIHFLKVELSGGNGAWKGQIGSVSIFHQERRDTSQVFYVDSENGSDANSGLSPERAWKSLEKINRTRLVPGDSVLLKSGALFLGTLKPQGSGIESQPIVFAKYGGNVLPVINSAGFTAGIQIENQSNIMVSDLEITSDAGEPQESTALKQRFGVNVLAGQTGEYKNITLKNLHIHHIFASENVESDGQNPTSNMGMGIQALMQNKTSVIKNLRIENCKIAYTGHTGIKIFGAGDSNDQVYLDSVFILNNHLENIGGPGMVPGRCSNVLVKGNVVSFSGSKADPRMHNRGSGIWPWSSKNVVIENNQFKNAWGKYDSCGAHIDFNCSNVVVQYNLSCNNAGGFVEILGNDTDCVYRYNISINDGYRKKGVNGALSDGHMFWLSAYVGQGNEPIGANHCKIYNNTVYIGKGIETGILLQDKTENNVFFNNIIYVDGSLTYEDNGENNVFNGNLWFGNIPELPFGDQALFADPQMINPGDTLPESYVLLENSPAINTAVETGEAELDYWGKSIANHLPGDRGASESDFHPPMISIQTSAGEGGTVFPSGEFQFPENSTFSVKIKSNPGYRIENVFVDGNQVENDSMLEFRNISEPHTVQAAFFAPADSITDPLDNFFLVSKFVNMRIQDENPDNFFGDTGRAQRNGTDPGFLIYQFKEIHTIEIEFWTTSNDDSELKIYLSDNGTDFYEVQKKKVKISDTGNRTLTVYSTLDAIPENTGFVKFEIVNGDAGWKAQIGSVFLSWWGDEKNVSTAPVFQEKEWRLFPNPVAEILFLKGIPGQASFVIYTLSGDKVMWGKTDGEIDVARLHPGFYLLKAAGFKEKLFIKQ